MSQSRPAIILRSTHSSLSSASFRFSAPEMQSQTHEAAGFPIFKSDSLSVRHIRNRFMYRLYREEHERGGLRAGEAMLNRPTVAGRFRY